MRMKVDSKAEDIKLHWLEGKQRKSAQTGVAWGVPWPIGTLDRNEQLSMRSASGANIPLQSWPTAYWPDGSVKWTAHAAVVPGNGEHPFRIEKATTALASQSSQTATGALASQSRQTATGVNASQSPLTAATGSTPRSPQTVTAAEAKQSSQPALEIDATKLLVRETQDVIDVSTGIMSCRIGKSGSALLREISFDGRRICSEGKLVALRESVSSVTGVAATVEETFFGEIASAEVEQIGEVRAVVKVTGRHKQLSGGRQWLPFTLRLYFYAGQEQIGLTHTFVYDGNPHRDAIKGLGMRFAIPMSGPLYNRHVRLAGDTGWFGESPKGLMTFRLTDDIKPRYKGQMDGQRVSFDPFNDKDAAFLRLLDDSAVWNDFKLTQLSADGYTIRKRTKEGCSWIKALSGRRARGVVYAGSEAGGIGLGVRNFWKQAPAGLQISHAASEVCEVTAWFWSPDSEVMDLRHYDTETHVLSSYEGADELRSTPYGIAHTTQCMLWCSDETPSHERLDEWADQIESPPQLVCEPSYYYTTKAFGTWSLPDRSTPLKAKLEHTLEGIIEFYQLEIEKRGWYGFWDYGDVMHSYDPVRHTWRYDIGGCAWQNAELVPNIWLWYMFLRTGRADIFRMAEAMTRHTSETDLYHIGEYAGLGSRHNVVHWGCGCKEARIGMAGLHKYYYYLTADERIGDLLDEVKDADYATVGLDPMRAYFPKDEHVTHTRSGPDWSAFCSNWLLQWERYEDISYRDKMLTGIQNLKEVPHRLLTGPTFGYDPKTGELTHMGHENYGHHLMICMGGAQVWMEMADLLDDPVWSEMLAEYGEFYNLPPEEKWSRTNGDIVGKDWNIPMLSTAMMAYAAAYYNNNELAKQAWRYLIGEQTHWNISDPLQTQAVPDAEYAYPIDEIPWISTNTASQWSINAIICLELIGHALPEEGTDIK